MNSENRNATIGHLACFIAYTIWGINIVVCKDLTGSNLISPIGLFTIRSIGAGLLFGLVSIFMPHEHVEKSDHLRIFIAAVIGYFFTQMSFLMAIPYITPMDCSIVSSLSPICTMFVAAIALREPITPKKIGGVALSFIGIIFLIFNSVSGDGGRHTTTVGVLLMLFNCACFSSYLGIFKPLIARYSVITFLKWIYLYTTLLSLPLSLQELVAINYTALPSDIVMELLFLILFSTFIAYFLIPVGQKHIRPTLVSMYSYVQPIIATAISIVVGMDTLSWQKIIAAIAVFSGVIIVNKSKARN